MRGESERPTPHHPRPCVGFTTLAALAAHDPPPSPRIHMDRPIMHSTHLQERLRRAGVCDMGRPTTPSLQHRSALRMAGPSRLARATAATCYGATVALCAPLLLFAALSSLSATLPALAQQPRTSLAAPAPRKRLCGGRGEGGSVCALYGGDCVPVQVPGVVRGLHALSQQGRGPEHESWGPFNNSNLNCIAHTTRRRPPTY